MDRRKFLKNAGLISGATLLPGNIVAQRNLIDGRSSERPNLVFVFADQLRTQSCGYFGGYADNPSPHTPNIDQLQSESVDFRNAVVNTPLCSPMRAGLMTGKFTSSHGQIRNEIRCMPDPDALGHVLGRHGYNRGYIGKWHLNNQQYTPPGKYRLGFDQEWKGFNFNHSYYKGFYYEDTNYRITRHGTYEPIYQTDMATKYIRDRAGEQNPFALFLSWGPPHRPWHWGNVPDEYRELFDGRDFPDPPNYEDGHAKYWVEDWDHEWWMNHWKPRRKRFRQVYAAMTASLDDQLKRIRDTLEEQGIADNTILVFTSDHGEMFGSQGRIQKNVIYEEAARVPFLIHWPDKIKPRVVDTAFNTPDIAPTLLSLMDLPVPESMEGEDLSHIALDEPGDDKDFALMQIMGHAFRWRNGHEWRAIRTKQYTYAYRMSTSEEFLFDNVNDPYQLNNRADDKYWQSFKKELILWMTLKMGQLNDQFRPQSYYRQHWMEDGEVVRSATRDTTTTDIEEKKPTSANSFTLKQNYPNPFNNRTVIRFNVNRADHYTLSIYDTKGHKIATLVDKKLSPGSHKAAWNGLNNQGKTMASGTYFYNLSGSNGRQITKPMTLLK